MTGLISARELFRAAYQNRYTWDANFPGYSADVQLKQGDELYTGKVCINSNLSVEVIDISDGQIQESLYTQLRDVVTQRQHNPFEQAHGRNHFNLGTTDEIGAIAILVDNDAMGSNYKVRNNEICQVNRVIGRMAFTIDHKRTLQTGEGYISSRYDAVFRNPQTNATIRVLNFEDTYEKIGHYYVLTHQVVWSHEQGQQTITEINFANVKLLAPAIV